jgi:superoxide dismutase
MACEPLSTFFNPPVYAPEGTHFDGLIKKSRPSGADMPCLKCDGYGMWNHSLFCNTYRPDMHPHSVHICTECNGSGWVWLPISEDV